MLETWLQSVLHHPEAILNKELLSALAVPGVVMAWVRKHSKLLEQYRNEARSSTFAAATNTLLFVDLNSKNDPPDGADPSGPPIADLEALGEAVSGARVHMAGATVMSADGSEVPSWYALCATSPVASFYARAALGSPGVRAVVSADELDAPIAACVLLMPHWFKTEPVIDEVCK
jgi:hypothetical protein